jgi:hypothetical protein
MSYTKSAIKTKVQVLCYFFSCTTALGGLWHPEQYVPISSYLELLSSSCALSSFSYLPLSHQSTFPFVFL